MDNIFNYIHYDMFKVLSSKDREFNYDILIYLYNYFCFQQGGAKAIKNDVILDLERSIDFKHYKDIDDEENEDIKNRSKRDIILYKYNQFKKTGWIEDGYNKDLEIEVNLTSQAISILSNLYSITEEDDLSEFSGYVNNCYNSLNSKDFYDKNKCFTYVEQAYIATKELSDKLNSMTSIIKRYTNNILSKEQFKANDIAKNVYEEYNDKIGIRLFNNLKIKDNPYKYKNQILELVKSCLNEDYLLIIDSYRTIKNKKILKEEDHKKIKDKLHFIYNFFDNINKRIDEIDDISKKYLSICTSKIKFIINESKDIEEEINNTLKLLNNDFDFSFFEDYFNITKISTLDDESYFKPRSKYIHYKEIPINLDIKNIDNKSIKEDLLNKIKASNEYSFSSINKFMISLLSNKKEVKISSILDKLKEIESSSVKLLLGLLYQYNDLASYTIIKLDDEVIIDNYRLMNFIIRGKNNG